MVAKTSIKRRLKAIWSRLKLDTKFLMMIGVLAVLTTGLVVEKDSCRVESVLALMSEPPDIFEEVTISDTEKSHIVTINLDGKEVTRPFGFIHDRWEKLKSRHKKGDCLYYYQIECGTLCGAEGYILIRDGEVIDSIQTRIS